MLKISKVIKEVINLSSEKVIPLRNVSATGPVSVKSIREEYFGGMMSEQELLSAFRIWQSLPIWLFFQNIVSGKIFAIRGVKRGDEKHARKAIASFGRALLLKPLVRQQQRTKTSPARTNVLWITGTYDGDTGSEAYGQIGPDFNRWITAMRKVHGKIDVVRVWESQERGTPHWHAILIFRDKTWSWFWKKRKGSRNGFHIPGVKAAYDPRVFGYKEIKKYWKHGWMDIKAVHDYEGAIGYLKKYLVKQLESREDVHDMALAHQMIYNNQVYSVPGLKNIAKATNDPDLIKAISNSNLSKAKKTDLCAFLGTFHSTEPLHRAHIYKLHRNGPDIPGFLNQSSIESVEFLFDDEVDGGQDQGSLEGYVTVG